MTARRTIRAQDLMQTKVITLSPEASVAEAIETFEEDHISGAPVVDGAGHLLGVLSASDVTRKEHVVHGRLTTERSEYYFANPLDEETNSFSDIEGYSPETEGPECVRDWMTPNIISVAPTATLAAVCKTMVRESVHRLLVVEDGKLKGIVSSFDVVRHFAGT